MRLKKKRCNKYSNQLKICSQQSHKQSINPTDLFIKVYILFSFTRRYNYMETPHNYFSVCRERPH